MSAQASSRFARLFDATPSAADANSLAALFPSGIPLGQKAYREDLEAFVRFSGSTWQQITSIVPAGVTVLSPCDPEFGGVGDGVADDTAAVVACLAAGALLGRCVIDVTGRRFRLTSPVTVSATATKFRGDGGLFGGGFIKAHTGDLFRWTGSYGGFLGVWLEADTATSTTYGTSGWALNFSSNSAAYGFRWIDGGSYHIDQIIRFAQDAGHEFHCVSAFLQPYNVTPGAEPTAILTAGDTTAAFRSFIDIWFPSKADISGALDTKFIASSMRTVVGSASTSITMLYNCIMANNNNPHTITGASWLIGGCRWSGSVTLADGSTGRWERGNMFTSGTLTDANSNIENWGIDHQVEDSNHRTMINRHTLRIGYGGMINPNLVVYHGDAAASLFNTDPPTHIWTAALTADRTVTLNTGASMFNGEHFWIERAITATGNFDLIVGATGVKLRPGESALVVYTGSLDSNSLWRVVVFGRTAPQGVATPTETVLVSGVDVINVAAIKTTITAARVVGAPLNPRAGQRVVHTFVQDGTGGWGITWNAVFKNGWSDTGNTANKRSSIEHYFDGTNWNQVGAQSPYVA